LGYSTTFWGQVDIVPPLTKKEIHYLQKFQGTRRMNRTSGEYFVDGTGSMGQGNDPDIINSNDPPPEQPSLWCGWTVTDDGCYIEWNGAEKFHDAEKWMWYILRNFLQKNAIARLRYPEEFKFLKGHICSGTIEAQGEDYDDRWKLVVDDNNVYVETGEWVYHEGDPVGNEELEMRYCFLTNKDNDKCDECKERFKCYTGVAPFKSYLSENGTYWK